MMAAKFLEPDAWGPGYVYATPRIKASSLYRDAVAYEEDMVRDFVRLFTAPKVQREDRAERYARAVALWERAGFFGWADNYRRAV